MTAKKKCTKCGRVYPAIIKYFGCQLNGKNGLKANCRECGRKYGKKYCQSKRGKEANKKYEKSAWGKQVRKKRRRSKKYKEYQKQYLKQYRESEEHKARAWKSHIKWCYNITIGEYNQLFQQQNGCCAICKRHQSELKCRLNVDHNHKTGKVRGLLCTDCNRMIGSARDNKNILSKAVEYLNVD